jgi:hypothetical protein
MCISSSKNAATRLQSIALAAVVFAATACSTEVPKYLEDEAINALDATGKTIGDLTSCSVAINHNSEELVDGTLQAHTRQSYIYLRENNKLHIYTIADGERKGFWYNGSELAVFRFDEATYDITPAPKTTIAMIDSINKTFKVDFPAVDVFYPTLADDVIDHFDTVLYLGTQAINGILCTEINARNKDLNIYLRTDVATKLPVQLEIFYRGEKEGATYVATYSNWQLNPNLPDEIFKFLPPSNATKASIFKK